MRRVNRKPYGNGGEAFYLFGVIDSLDNLKVRMC
jgi:hypothetical protein